MSTKVIGGIVVLSLLMLGAYALSTHSTKGGREVVLTNPTTGPENTNLSIGARLALQNDLEGFAQERIAQGELTNYSIYFRELMGGPVIALNQEEGFFPASLLKLPVAMWYFNEAQSNPELLENQIEFSGPNGTTVGYFLPEHSIEPGNIYTIQELIEYMLTQSDNDATAILHEYAGGMEKINEVYHDLDIRPVEDFATYVIDTQTYAAFFRVLYNAEYLDRPSSERILSILSNSSFTKGLVRDIPKEVVVAHKFGERPIDPENEINQLHDCGIVYAPKNPYLVCVMTQGRDYDRMANFIAEASSRIYQVVSGD